jgi:TRAP-type C4-dicarboxylate transport system substrate-binding protein
VRWQQRKGTTLTAVLACHCAAFLNQKSWHPLSYRNQKALFEAEAAAAKQRDADAKAKEEFESEAEYFRRAFLLREHSTACPDWS